MSARAVCLVSSAAAALGAAAPVPARAQRAATTARSHCTRPADTTYASYLALDPPSARASTVTAWVCIATPTSGGTIGSYHGEVAWDSTAARALDARQLAPGAQATNINGRGVARFAGAFTRGFAGGELLRLRFRRLKSDRPVRLVLRWNDITFSDARAALRNDSLAPPRPDVVAAQSATTCRPSEVKLFTLAPDTFALSSGDRSAVMVRGCGFAAVNTVEVGPATLRGVRASKDGTELLFVVPQTLDATGEVPPMTMPRGNVTVRVVTAAGASNTLTLVLK